MRGVQSICLGDNKLDVYVCVVDRKMMLVINSSDDNYVPHRIIVMGGSSSDHLHKLNDVTIDQCVDFVFCSELKLLGTCDGAAATAAAQ